MQITILKHTLMLIISMSRPALLKWLTSLMKCNILDHSALPWWHKLPNNPQSFFPALTWAASRSLLKEKQFKEIGCFDWVFPQYKIFPKFTEGSSALFVVIRLKLLGLQRQFGANRLEIAMYYNVNDENKIHERLNLLHQWIEMSLKI